MATGSINRSDLPRIHGIVQHSMLSYPKELCIEILRDYFSQDVYYAYNRDAWGFPQTPDHTDLPLGSGMYDDITTRLFIGEAYRHNNMRFFPAILIKGGSFTHVPISMSRNEEWVQYRATKVTDGYTTKYISVPEYISLAGAWEGQLILDIIAADIQARDELVQMVAAMIESVHYRTFQNAGVFIKSTSIGSPSEKDDYNDKLFYQSITLDIRTEWRKNIPINSILESINFCIDLGNLEDPNDPKIAPNLSIQENINLIDMIQNL
jgi:hypothetical protein